MNTIPGNTPIQSGETVWLNPVSNLWESHKFATTASDVNLGNANNTSDADKPISTAAQAALDNKQDIIPVGATAQYYRGDKSWQTLDKGSVGLPNVDNTSDAGKPISTATQTALDAKQGTIVAGTTGQYYRGDKTWQTLDKTAVGLPNVDNTTDLNKPVSTATQTALDGKLNTPAGSTSQYVRGDGSLNTFPTIPTQTSQLTNNSGFITSVPVTSVASKTGAVVLVKADVGLPNVDNTSDANKPISTATQSALDAKEGTITGGTTAQYYRGDKSWQALNKAAVGLPNVDNTSDSAKPVSSATAAAIALKYDIPAGSTSQYVRGDGTLATFPTIPGQPTVNNNVSRTLNSAYTISSNVRGVYVSYSINVSWSIAALLSGTATAFLEFSTDGGTNWITVNNVGKSIGLLTFAGADDMNLVGFIPSSATNVRIRTTQTNMVVAYTRGQETLV